MSEISNKNWDLGYELSYDDPKAAIEHFKLAAKTNNHPFLYTNIASAYYRLGDIKKAETWYKKAEPILLTLEDRYSANPYANYAFFLYNDKKDYEKALEFSSIAMSIDTDSIVFIENHIRILIALDRLDESIPHLTDLRLVAPDWEPVQDLLKDYKTEIDNYYESNWELRDKMATFEEIINLHDLDHEKILKYLSSKRGAIPDIEYEKWPLIFTEMLNTGIEIQDPIFVKLFKILIKKEDYLKLFNFLTNLIDNTKTGFLLMLSLAKQAGLKKEVTIKNILKGVTKDNEKALVEALSENLMPSYKKDIKEWIKALNNPVARIVLIQVMQKTHPEYYKEEIKDYLNKNLDSKMFNTILSNLTDKKLQEELFNKKLESWFDSKPEFKNDSLLLTSLTTFIATNKKTALNKVIERYKQLFKYEVHFDFWKNFIENYPAEIKDPLYNKAFRISLILDPHVTIANHIGFDKTLSRTTEEINKYTIPLTFFIKYLIKDIHKKEDKGQLIVDIIKNHFEETLFASELVTIKERVEIIPLIWEHQKERFAPILIELTASNSKTIQNMVASLLKKDDALIEQVIDLLKARKVSTRSIAVEVLLSKNEEKYNLLVKDHLSREKSDSIRKLISKALGILIA